MKTGGAVMWKVVGGLGRRSIARPCESQDQAEQWARQLIHAGITPVRINGVLFGPETGSEAKDVTGAS